MTVSLLYEPFGRDTWQDPYTLYRHLLEHEPVQHVPDGGYWVLSRFRDVFDAARDTETFSSAQGLTFQNEIEAMGLLANIVMMDPPDHTKYRRLVGRRFTPRQVSDLEPALRRFARACVERLVEDGDGDFVSILARPGAVLRGRRVPRRPRAGSEPLRGLDRVHRPGRGRWPHVGGQRRARRALPVLQRPGRRASTCPRRRSDLRAGPDRLAGRRSAAPRRSSATRSSWSPAGTTRPPA